MCPSRTLLLALLVGIQPALAERTEGERIDDAEISARVKAALVDDETAKARPIDVETQSGVVQLSGFVESEASKRAAESAARSVEGVTEVRNALMVRRGDRTTDAVVDDTVIAAKVKAQLVDETGLGTGSAVDVEVIRGVVQLSGFVDSEDERHRAERIADNVQGVTEVRNEINVLPEH
jgi:hyperosmotically inducible periplasmic protein